MPGNPAADVAVVWRGDCDARETATPQNNRVHRIFEELARLGIRATPAVYDEAFADAVKTQLRAVDGVLVWVDPLDQRRTRSSLDRLLREVAALGPWVSAHPDTILKVGTKQVLYRTRDLSWGTDTHLYSTAAEFREAFPNRLRSGGPRVLKQNRGNGGQGVWKVEAMSDKDGRTDAVRVLHALRGSVPEDTVLSAFMARCEAHLDADGCIVDQPFQARLTDGMIRCYMAADRVVGFGHQRVKALVPPPPEGPDAPEAQPGPRIMHGAGADPFQALRTRMEAEWTPRMMAILGLDRASLPIIWDADFLYGPRTPTGEDTYVLCEINVSSVFPLPPEAPAAIARLVKERLVRAG